MPTKTRRKTAVQADADGAPSLETIRQALDELGINRPFYTCRVVGNRLELALYGGDLVYWPPKPAPKRKR